MKVLGFELGQHPGEIWKLLAIDGEGKILILKIDVQINGIGRDPVSPETISDLEHSRLQVITVAGLLETERPHRGERRLTCKPRIGFEDLPGGGTVNEVVAQGTIHRAKGVDPRLRL